MFVYIGVDVELHHACAVRAVAQHGGRDDRPAQALAYDVSCDLAVGQRAFGKVPQRALTPARLIDGVDLEVVPGDGDHFQHFIFIVGTLLRNQVFGEEDVLKAVPDRVQGSGCAYVDVGGPGVRAVSEAVDVVAGDGVVPRHART